MGSRLPGAGGRRALSALAGRLAVLVGLAALARGVGRFGARCWLADLAAHCSVFYLLLAALATPVLLAAGRRRSAGLIATALDPVTGEVVWGCPVCGQQGRIHHWQGSRWDGTARLPRG